MKKFTIEEVNDFTFYLKDYLCRIYNHIERFQGSTDDNHKGIDFTRAGVTLVGKRLSVDGMVSDEFVDRFINNLEIIKSELVDKQPMKEVEFKIVSTNIEEGETEPRVSYLEVKTYTSFDLDMIDYQVARENRHGKYIVTVLSSKNI